MDIDTLPYIISTNCYITFLHRLYDMQFIVYGLSFMIYGLLRFMVAHGSNLWDIPAWELVPDTIRTDLETITCKWCIQFIYYYWFLF